MLPPRLSVQLPGRADPGFAPLEGRRWMDGQTSPAEQDRVVAPVVLTGSAIVRLRPIGTKGSTIEGGRISDGTTSHNGSHAS
jgi:hypothetical protein